MKLKPRIRRAAAGLLAAVLALSLCACSKTVQPSETAADEQSVDRTGVEKVKLEHVYKMEYLDLGANKNNSFDVTGAGNAVFLSSYYYEDLTEEDGTYNYRSGTLVYKLDVDTSTLTLLRDFVDSDGNYDPNATSMDSVFASYLTGAPDGTIWYNEQRIHDDWSDENNYIYEVSSSLVHLDAQGQELNRIALEADEEDSYFYLSSLSVQSDGSVVAIMDPFEIRVYASDGTLKSKTEPASDTNSWSQASCFTGNGDFVTWQYSYNETTNESVEGLYTVNLSTGEQTLIGTPPITYAYTMCSGSGDTILLQNTNSIYSYDIKTGEFREVVNWINSDVNGMQIRNVIALEDGSFLATEYADDYSEMRLARMVPASEGDLTEKYLLTLAAVGLNSDLYRAVISFNKQNADYRIQFADYSVYNTTDDYQAGVDQLNRDIISGDMPDLIDMSQLSVDTYAARGLLADIGTMMDNDSSFSRSDYVDNVLCASTYKGSVVSVIPSFYISTLAASPNYVSLQNSWTIEDMIQLAQQNPDSTLFGDSTTRDSLINWFSCSTIHDYLDLDNASASFNDPSFVSFLEFLKGYPSDEEFDWDAYSEHYNDADYNARLESQYRDGYTLLQTQYLSSFDNIRSIMWSFGEDFIFLGYPSKDGAGINVIQPNMEIAVASGSKMKDVCWEFIKYLISYDCQKNLSWCFPVNRQAMDEQKEAARPSSYTYEGSAAAAAGETEDYYSRDLTDEQLNQIVEVIDSAHIVQRDYEEIVNIINEEAASYYSGQKTAQAAADIIQSRVSIYISENS